MVAAINAHYRLPPPPELPQSLTIRTGFRARAILDAAGLRTVARGRDRFYRWEEVQRLLIERHDALRRDFVTLEIVLPDGALELSHIHHDAGRPTATWQGPSAEEISEFLLRCLPADKIETGILGEPAPGFALRQKRLAKLRTTQRALYWGWALCALALVISGLVIGRNEGVIAGTVLPGIWLVAFGPIFFMVHRRLTVQILDLER